MHDLIFVSILKTLGTEVFNGIMSRSVWRIQAGEGGMLHLPSLGFWLLEVRGAQGSAAKTSGKKRNRSESNPRPEELCFIK